MKFIVSSTALSSRLQAISRVINSKNTIPALNCFLMTLKGNQLTVIASDTDTRLTTTIEVTEGEGDGSIAVVARPVLDSLKEIPEQPLTFNIDPQTYEVTINYLNGKYNMVGQDPAEYPLGASTGAEAENLELDAVLLLTGISRTLFATAEDELRPVMNGIYVDLTESDVTFVASDGHKLVRFYSSAGHADAKSAFILPKKPAGLLRNLLPHEEGNVQIQFDNRTATFTTDNYSLTCRLIEGRYPNYNSVIPKQSPCRMIADRQQLLGASKRVSVFTSPQSSLLRLHIAGNQALVSTQDYDFSVSAEETVECQYDGSEMSIGFKSTFLIDTLSNIPGEEVVLELADSSRAGILTPAQEPETESLIMLLMPMMLNE